MGQVRLERLDKFCLFSGSRSIKKIVLTPLSSLKSDNVMTTESRMYSSDALERNSV